MDLNSLDQMVNLISTVLPLSEKITRSDSFCIRKTPLPPQFETFSGKVGSGIEAGSKPGPSSDILKQICFFKRVVLTQTNLDSSDLLPCNMALLTASVKDTNTLGYRFLSKWYSLNIFSKYSSTTQMFAGTEAILIIPAF